MSAALSRKFSQLVKDPVLRRWLFLRLCGRTQAPGSFAPHMPPYVQDQLPLKDEYPAESGHSSDFTAGTNRSYERTALELAGTPVSIEPGDEGRLFSQDFGDLEAHLALHRFQWLPLMAAEGSVPPALVTALWRIWADGYGTPTNDWPWHPYTAAERSVNLLDHARRSGWSLGEDDRILLARHAPEIARRFEYFGEHDTSNHLAANGRGLYALGLELGLPDAAALGFCILKEEAFRLFMPSGFMREGSSHYHLLLLRTYIDAWLRARRHGRTKEAEALASIAGKAARPLSMLALPGGQPLVGDVSPDCPPGFLAGLVDATHRRSGWFALLDEKEREDVARLLGDAAQNAHAPGFWRTLAADGWLRADQGDWALLCHASPDGFPPMPGHGHQDTGGFELHWKTIPLFVDAGRGRYGDTGDAAHARDAEAHNGLSVDGAAPFPANKPYYDPAFRRGIAGPPPLLAGDGTTARLIHHGFARLSGVKSATRIWNLSSRALRIDDAIEGQGRHTIERRLLTPWPVKFQNGRALVAAPGQSFAVKADADIRIEPAVRWPAYGTEAPAMQLRFISESPLPFDGSIAIEVL